eukprot:996884_1
MYGNIRDLDFEFRNMMDEFKQRMRHINLDELFEDDSNIYTDANNQLVIYGAVEIRVRLRGMNNKYAINDIAVPLLTGFTKKAITHCLTFCSRIFWKIIADEWWDYDEDPHQQQNNTNILYHVTHTSFDELFPSTERVVNVNEQERKKRYRNSSVSSSGSSMSSYTSSGDDTRTRTCTLQSESFPVSSESSFPDFDVEIDHMQIPTVCSMNAPLPMLMSDDDDNIKQDDTEASNVLVVQKYYRLHFKWRKYVHFVMVLCILYASIITVIYGVHLDFGHYFENEFVSTDVQ